MVGSGPKDPFPSNSAINLENLLFDITKWHSARLSEVCWASSKCNVLMMLIKMNLEISPSCATTKQQQQKKVHLKYNATWQEAKFLYWKVVLSDTRFHLTWKHKSADAGIL